MTSKKMMNAIMADFAEELLDKFLDDLDIVIWSGPIRKSMEKSMKNNLKTLLKDYNFEYCPPEEND